MDVILLTIVCFFSFFLAYKFYGTFLSKKIFKLDINITSDKEFCCDLSLSMDKFTQATSYVAPDWEEMVLQMYKDPTDYDSMRKHN